MGDADYILALELQKEFDRELEQRDEVVEDMPTKTEKDLKDKWAHRRTDLNLDCTQNLVHPQWETLDPTPDAQALFQAFDNKFFQGRLKCVTLEWSKRMYSCAGICYSRRNGYGMAITIRLSEPLLKLRSRKDLIETLLHEMIHAYCSVLGIREGNGGHGPNFKKIMCGINKVAGTNITVYHTFHDEVSLYKTHWWRCNGICQHRKPFLGYVKRTSNRAPGPNDVWWNQHLESCGGTFLKIREPEKKRPVKGEKEKVMKVKKEEPVYGRDIRGFFNTNVANPQPKRSKTNGAGTVATNDSPDRTSKALTSTPKKETNKTFGSNRVMSFQDLTGNSTTIPKKSTNQVFDLTGGYSLNGPKTTKISSNATGNKADANHIRNIWANRFPNNSATKRTNEEITEISTLDDNCPNPSDCDSTNIEKKRKIDQNQSHISLNDENDEWEAIDEEIMLKATKDPVIDISSDENDDEDDIKPQVGTIPNNSQQSPEERQRLIKQEIIDSSDFDLSASDIILIDDDYDDELVTAGTELADTSLIDELFGEDTLLCDFKRQNAVFASNSRYHADPKNDIICCPVCQENVMRKDFPDHLDGCVGISEKVSPLLKIQVPQRKKKMNRSWIDRNARNVNDVLKRAGYNSNEIAEVLDDSNEPQDESFNRRQGLDTSTHFCPKCGGEVPVDRINEHLDVCLPDE